MTTKEKDLSVSANTTASKPEDDKVIVITLKDIITFFKQNRRTIFIAAIVGGLIGAIYALNKPNIYTSQVTVMPEIQAKGAGGLGGLGSLAGLAGISLENLGGQDAIHPDLYPNILQSVPFALDLLKQPVYSQKLGTTTTLQDFIEIIAKEGVISKILNVFTSNSKTKMEERLDPQNFSKAIQVTKEQSELIKIVHNSITAAYDKKTGIITISSAEPDPVVSASIARLSLEYLTNYIITYRTEKARKQVAFLAHQVAEAQDRYKSAELTLSAYRDRNRGLYLNTAKIDEQRLQSDYILAQSVYTDLAKQLEQAKIKVQEETPVFKILEPPTVPLIKSGPKRTVIMLGMAITGGFLWILFLLARSLAQRSFTMVA